MSSNPQSQQRAIALNLQWVPYWKSIMQSRQQGLPPRQQGHQNQQKQMSTGNPPTWDQLVPRAPLPIGRMLGQQHGKNVDPDHIDLSKEPDTDEEDIKLSRRRLPLRMAWLFGFAPSCRECLPPSRTSPDGRKIRNFEHQSLGVGNGSLMSASSSVGNVNAGVGCPPPPKLGSTGNASGNGGVINKIPQDFE